MSAKLLSNISIETRPNTILEKNIESYKYACADNFILESIGNSVFIYDTSGLLLGTHSFKKRC